MITNAIINVLLAPVNILLDLLPAVDVSIPADAFNSMSSVFDCIGFVLPVSAICPVLLMCIGLKTARSVMALVVRIKSFIPTMGA